MDLGKNIAKARKDAGMTQEQLAEKMQVARQTVSKWETGITMQTVPGLVKIFVGLAGTWHYGSGFSVLRDVSLSFSKKAK